MLLKITGALLIVGATSWGGIIAAARLQNQYAQMQYLQRLIYRLKSEIQYANSYLGEAFRQIGSNSVEPYRRWMFALSEQMERRNGHVFADIWEENVREYLDGSGLPEDTLERLLRLGGQLGIADIEMQVKLLELYLEELKLAMEEMREGMKSKIRLYHCLGVMSGIFVTVLLI
ncbi:stage III sporulation protein AB [Bariatricus sp. SGI.154]|uniref:stage III sporulation protein AB n=1 Tax=Bariatricus sp. SGI.154 TaxID=3420549 RepID=UPI003D057C81